LRVAFTHSAVQIRKAALEILLMVFDTFPALARKDNELYDSFLSLMKSQKKPNSRELLKEAVQKFRAVYESPESDENSTVFEMPPQNGWTVANLDGFASRFYFPVFYGCKTTAKRNTDTSWLEQFM
jgi:hypothetical protein